ncbi:hypothetical protein ACFX13_019910 [Malus domestica]
METFGVMLLFLRRPMLGRSLCNHVEYWSSGLRWDIGNGEIVHVWKDKWIPRLFTFKICTSMPPMLLDLKVKDLVLVDGMRWDVALLQQLFLKDKSTYQVARHMIAHSHIVASSSFDNGGAYRGPWHAIWKPWVPPKVKICGWNVCNDILPTRRSLSTKGVRLDVSCPRCNAVLE